MITQAKIFHYKGIAAAELAFKSINVLTGKNGAGKSNIVDAMYFLHDAITEDLDTAVTKRHGIESIRQWSRRKPFDITIDLSFSNAGGTGRYRVVLGSGRGSVRVKEEFGEWFGPSPFKPQGSQDNPNAWTRFVRDKDGGLEYEIANRNDASDKPKRLAHSELFLTSLSGPFRNLLSIYLAGIIRELTEFYHYSIYPNTLRQPQIVTRDETLNSDGSNLATIIKRINSGLRREKDSLIESMRFVMPTIADIQVKSAGGYYVPMLRVNESGSGLHDFNMSQVSDGTLRVLGLLTAFYQPNAPEKIALEEPEQMIHPGALPVLADAINEFISGHAAVRNERQIFVTTHSPNFLDLFPPESIFWVAIREGLTECGPISARQLALVKSELFTAGELLVSEGLFA